MHTRPIPPAVQKIISVASAEDLAELGSPRKFGALTPFEEEKQYRNIIFTGCSDGHRAHLWLKHLELCNPENGGCFHPFKDHGGALTLAMNTPLAAPQVVLYKVKQVQLGYTVVKPCTEQVVLTSHWPCKAAALAKMTIVEEITYLVCAKLCVRHLLPDSPPIALYHKVDTADGVAITEAVGAKRFIEWLEYFRRPELAIVREQQETLRHLHPMQ